jgi:hypothetical protein
MAASVGSDDLPAPGQYCGGKCHDHGVCTAAQFASEHLTNATPAYSLARAGDRFIFFRAAVFGVDHRGRNSTMRSRADGPIPGSAFGFD